MKLFLLLLIAMTTVAWGKNNLHLIDAEMNGFGIYRTSEPNIKDMKTFCKLGITEMMVLSGTAEKNELKLQKHCPTLKVIYNTKQSSKVPLDISFLKNFDAWVAKAKSEGRKIAFRCECGCHRTGRLAAYYQMKYQGLSLMEALTIMHDLGKIMFMFPHLPPQVQSLQDYIQGRPCSVDKQYCVLSSAPSLLTMVE